MPSESAIDKLIITYAGVKSDNEVGDITGLDAIEVAQRRTDILNRVLLGEDEVFAKMLYEMQNQIAEMGERVPHAKDEDAARLANTLAGLAGRVLKAIEDRKKAKEKDDGALQNAFTRTAIDLIDQSFNRYLGRLIERFPEADHKAIEKEFRETLILVAAEHDAL